MDDRPLQDHRLAQEVLRGNQEAFRVLVARYQRLVASVAWRFGIRPGEVEDVVSDVFFKVYKKLNRYRPAHPFSTWLYRLTVNHLVDRVRRARREGQRAELPEQIEDDTPTVRDGLLANERARMLRAALAMIDPKYREVLTLVYVEGLKVEEASRLLSVPQGTVKTRLMRGRDALRRLLTRQYPGYFEV